MEELAWLGVTRGVAGATEVVGAHSKARATRTALPVAQAMAKGRAIRMGLPEGKGRATRMDLSGAEGKATRMALEEERALKVAGVVVGSRLYPPEGVTGVEAGVAMRPGYAQVILIEPTCCLHVMLASLPAQSAVPFTCMSGSLSECLVS